MDFIKGNGDRLVLAQMAGQESSEVPEQFREVRRWTAQQLHPEHERLFLHDQNAQQVIDWVQ